MHGGHFAADVETDPRQQLRFDRTDVEYADFDITLQDGNGHRDHARQAPVQDATS
jgi:hypothetical protein